MQTANLKAPSVLHQGAGMSNLAQSELQAFTELVNLVEGREII